MPSARGAWQEKRITRMKFSPLVDRVKGESVAAWTIHYQAREAQLRGEDVIVLSIGDPDLETPAPGRRALREAIAQAHTRRTSQAVDADNVIFLSGAQNSLFAASLCVAGPVDDGLALELCYPG